MAEIRTYIFEEGNTAREVAPVREWEVIRQRRFEEELRREKAAKRQKEAMIRRSRAITWLLIGTIAMFCAFFVALVSLQNSITTSLKHISTLETQVSDLKADNSATENRINAKANLENVKYTAINQLGMVYANSDQIVYYDMDNTDSMNQYAQIP